jgi:hypothetical protein
VDTKESSVFRPSAAIEDHPHACMGGYIYLGYTGEDDEELIERLPCRRCTEEGVAM